MMNYPPCGSMLSVSVSAEKLAEGETCIGGLAAQLRREFGERVEIIGPAAGAVRRIKDRFRLVLYVKVRTAFEMDQVRKSIDDWKEKKNDSNYLQYEVDEPVR